MGKGKLNLSAEGKNHFCIKNASIKDIIAAMNVNFSEAFVFEPDFDWATLVVYSKGINLNQKARNNTGILLENKVVCVLILQF